MRSQGPGHENSMDETEVTYQVVVNHEGQYSIWFVGEALPAGWSADGKIGTRQECLGHIASVWTDMRPASLRVSPLIGGAA